MWMRIFSQTKETWLYKDYYTIFNKNKDYNMLSDLRE